MLACEGEHILEKSIGYMLSESCTGCYTMDCDDSRHPVFGFIPQSLYLSLLKSGNKCDFIELKNYRENKGYTKNNDDVYCLFFSITHITTEYLQTGIESMYYLFRNHKKIRNSWKTIKMVQYYNGGSDTIPWCFGRIY